MTLLSDGLLRTLDVVALASPLVLFLRHAERRDIAPTDPYADVDLTERGREQASELARMLPYRPVWAAVSPFLRCKKTAHLLQMEQLEIDQRLGRPGPWVVDEKAGARLFAELGTEGVVRAQIAGSRWPFVRSPREGTKLLLTVASERLAAGRGSGVCVSHDAVLMPVIAALTEDRFPASWLAPLDGFALHYTDDKLRCTWRGRTHEVPIW